MLRKLNGGKYMEQDSHGKEGFQKEVLEAQVRESFGRVVYSHKTHEKCADIAFRLHKRLKLTQIVLSAIVTTSLIMRIFGDNETPLYIGALLSTLLFGLNMYMKDYDLGELTQKHSNAGSMLWNIRESYTSLLADIRAGVLVEEEIIRKRDELQDKLFGIYTGAPRTFSRAYKEASRALQVKEELTFSAEEINSFLPEELRRIK